MRGEQPAAGGTPPALPLVIVEDRSDHRELLADEIESVLPDEDVIALSGDASLPGAARVVLASLATDPARVIPWLEALHRDASGPALVLISGEGDRWREDAKRRWPGAPRLDKRDGLAFLADLGELVSGIAGTEGPGPAPEPRASAPGEAPRAPRASAGEAGPGPPPSGADSRAELERTRRELLLAGILAGEVEAVLGRLAALSGLFRHRAPRDPAIERYAACLADEVGRGRAVAARIAALGLDDARSRGARLMAPGDLVKLRVAAWRRWLPGDTTIQVHLDARAPRVAAWPEVLGPLLDEIVGLVVRDDAGPPRLSLRVDAVYREIPLGAARWARLEIAGFGSGSVSPARREDARAVIDRARTVMAAHGGDVEHSGLDGGDASPRVALLVPEALPEPAPPAAGAAAREESSDPSPPGTDEERSPSSARVLVVDDDPSIRETASEMLEVVGHVAVSVPSGEAAVKLLEAGERFDLVLLDMQMGGMDGRRTFNELRRIDPRLRAILVSGSASGTELRSLLGEGLLGFLPKPFSVAGLKEVVESALAEP